ncbi:chromosome condensation-related protein [Trichosporon asahii var. asahii CBS 8904]|uniref:Chromosome condensation-related protein n=1 Tax=Trichosporon asahii var. asahii (strain CBS 8904) TaxID=1220162 RepID=K1VMH2_TRIAC|nr:chromosome condensation-related protein [Trichosporon asahii var. asahii CBS 8904]
MATDIWNDYPHFVNNFIPKLTVPKLKHVAEAITRIAGINLHLRSGERKQDVVDKIRTAFETIKRQNNTGVYRAVRKGAEAIANGGASNPVMPPPTFGGVHLNHHYGGGAARVARPQAPAARAGASSGWHQAPGASSLYQQHPTHQNRLEAEPDVEADKGAH